MGGIGQLVPDVSLNKINLINSIDTAVQINIELKLIHHLSSVCLSNEFQGGPALGTQAMLSRNEDVMLIIDQYDVIFLWHNIR